MRGDLQYAPKESTVHLAYSWLFMNAYRLALLYFTSVVSPATVTDEEILQESGLKSRFLFPDEENINLPKVGSHVGKLSLKS